MIDEDHNYRVQIKIKTQNIWNIDKRVLEVNQIRAWLDELVEWQPDAYSMRYRHNFPGIGPIIDVWFKHEHHATACTLRWS